MWTALSRACHHHPYELAPTAAELEGCCRTVSQLVEHTEQAWANKPSARRDVTKSVKKH